MVCEAMKVGLLKVAEACDANRNSCPKGSSIEASGGAVVPSLPPVLLTYRDAAKILKVTDRTVWGLVKARKLKAVRFDRTVRIDPRDLEAFIQARKAAVEAN
jgi:excisionase family DNA binding protein